MTLKLNNIIILFFLNYFYMEAQSKISSWIEYNPETEIFPIQNIPFGVCKTANSNASCCSRISNYAIELSVLESNGLLNSENFTFNKENPIFNRSELNAFIELSRNTWKAIRKSLQNIFSDKNFQNNEVVRKSLIEISQVVMQMPVKCGDYTDFYSSKNHAFNMGSILRGPENALQPNWVHLPVGYHGKLFSIKIELKKFY